MYPKSLIGIRTFKLQLSKRILDGPDLNSFSPPQPTALSPLSLFLKSWPSKANLDNSDAHSNTTWIIPYLPPKTNKLGITWRYPARIRVVQTYFGRPRSKRSLSPSVNYSLSSFSLSKIMIVQNTFGRLKCTLR